MKKIFLIALTTLVLASCDNNEDNQLSLSEAATITATIGENVISRAADGEWHENDSIGISSIVGDVAGPYFNLKYINTGNKVFTGRTPILFYKPMTLTAYYPFTGKEGEVPGTDGIISATTDPDNQTNENRPKIDFLWDSKTGVNKKDFSAANPNVNFTFAHKMSKLSFTFLSSGPTYDDKGKLLSDGVDVNTMISYEIKGLGVEGTFDTTTGVCSLDEKKREGLKMTFYKIAEKMDQRPFDPLIVFPQKNDDGFTLLITTDELNQAGDEQKYDHQTYKCDLRFGDNEIKPGYHYKFVIKVTKLGLIVGELSIEPWVSFENFMTATIDGDVFKND